MRTKSGRGDVLLVCMVLFLVVFGLACYTAPVPTMGVSASEMLFII